MDKLPINEELEQTILGEMLYDKYGVDCAVNCLEDSDFYFANNKQIFRTIKDLYNNGQAVDFVSVSAKMDNDDNDTAKNYIINLFWGISTSANIKTHCNMLLELSYRRRSIELAEEIKKLAYANDVDKLGRAINKLQENEQSATEIEAIPLILDRTLTEIAENKKSKKKLAGYATGIYDLDDLISGLEEQKLFIIAGRPAMGKSSLALNIGHHIAKHNRDKNVIFFSLEMTKKDVALKLYSSALNINNEHFKFNMLTAEELLKISKQTDEFAEEMKNFYIEDDTNVNIYDIQKVCRSLKNKTGKETALIIIDYLQIVQTMNNSNRATDLGEISRVSVLLAKEFKCPVILLSQVNRSCESRNNKRPMLSDLKESGNIEQDADTVMFIYRDEIYDKKSKDIGKAEIIVAKQRNGSLGAIKVMFNKKTTTFYNIYRG